MFKRTTIHTAAVLAMGSLFGLDALAQDQRIEITGSSIRRIDAEASLPVQVLKKEDIARSGATSTTDLLQRLPAIQGSFQESGSVGGGSQGFTSVSIHNIGDTRTLVLLNGRRLAQFGGQAPTGFGAAMDLNAIPIAAIERVEILTDGASSLYGADAIAGVVNFITRRDATDGDVTIGISSPAGGARETRLSATKGFGSLDKDGFNAIFSFAHDERTKLDAKDRNFGATGKLFFNNNGKSYRIQQFSPSPIPANVLDDLGQLISPYQKTNGSCPEKTFRVIEPYNDGSGLVDDYCGFDFVGELEIYPIRKRDTMMASGTMRLGSHELFADLTYAQSRNIARIAPVPGSISIPTTSPLFAEYLAPIGITADTLAFYRLYDLGKRESDSKAKFYDISVGSKGLFAGWDYNASISHSRSESKESIGGYPGALAVGRLRRSGLLDPFLLAGEQSAEAQAAIDGTSYKGYWDGGVSNLDVVQVHGSREIMAMPAGPMMLGAGLSYQVEKFQSKPSLFAQAKLADPVAGILCDPAAAPGDALECDQRFGDESAIIPYSANRKSYGLFGELVVPVAKNFEVIGAVRYDHYSDFGNATTAKASFRFTPMKNLLIRGSVGTGFHAPTVPQVNASQQPFGVTNDDYTCTPELLELATALGAQCQPGSKQYDVITGGNKNLKPEKSKQASIGIRFEPTPQVSVGADLWHVNLRDSFGQVSESELFGKPLQYRSAWVTKRDTGTGVIYLASLQSNVNLGKEFYTGLDLDLTGRAKTDFGDLTSQFGMTYMIKEKRQLIPDGPFFSPIGNFAELGTATFRWKGKWTNTLKTGNWAHTFGLNFQSGYKDQETTVEVLDATGAVTGTEDIRLDVKEYFTLDWQTSYAFRKDMLLTIGALNLFDTKPPLAISSGGNNRGQQFGFDDRYYDSRGRSLYANFSYKF